MNWRVVETVFKALISLGIVMWILGSNLGGPEGIVREAVVLADNDPFMLLAYTFGTVVVTCVVYAFLGVMFALHVDDLRR